MKTLELKIPPVALFFIVAIGMWGIRTGIPSETHVGTWSILASLVIPGLGGVIALWGVYSFKRAHTTVDPRDPSKVTVLVTSGIYKYTRNPMYVGLLLCLIGWACYLSQVGALVGPLIFVLYMNRFQIVPEERVLTELFGVAFSDYCCTVRRWV